MVVVEVPREPPGRGQIAGVQWRVICAFVAWVTERDPELGERLGELANEYARR